MRPLFSLLLLTAFLLSSCGQGSLSTVSPPSTSPIPPLTLTSTSPSPTRTATTTPPTPSPSLPSSTPTGRLVATSAFTFQQGTSLPDDRPLIAYETGGDQDKTLVLTDPAESTSAELTFPAETHFATPFLTGLSPDARFFVYFEGGWLETPYDVEHLRASTPDLVLHVLDLGSGEVIFSTPLLSPSFPQNLAPIADTIEGDWWFENYSFADVVAATQEMMLDHIRRVAWSPDGSLLAFASQNDGPSSDLYFFDLELGTAQRMAIDPGHVLRAIWAPDSSVLIFETSLYDRHAREDTTYLLSRKGSLLTSLTSQLWFFAGWHDSKHAILYGATDSGDYFEPKTISATDGSISLLWEGSFADIAFSPDLSTFLLSSNIPSAPIPPHAGLFLRKPGDVSLFTLAENMGWEVDYWGSERFAFAASSMDEGTIGVTPDGERVMIDNGYWKLVASPGGRYLTGFFRYLPGYLPGIVPGLRVFDGDGLLLESIDEVDVTCVHWNAAATVLAYQVESRLYLWDALSGSTRLISDQLNQEVCAFKWVQDAN
jgi:hypothetical protein